MIQNYSEIKSLLDRIFALLDEESRRSEQKIQTLEKRIEALEKQLKSAEHQSYPQSQPQPQSQLQPKPQPHVEMETEFIIEDEGETIVEVEDNFWDDGLQADSTEPLWMFDMPGEAVEDVRDAISFNDRINFISELFEEDDEQYELTMDRINEAGSFRETVSEMRDAFDWDEDSDTVYRFYMAVRRKFE